ncbi:hypothetical protein [Flavobacterium restrictum]|uniref:Uncharacterized protein n=1 Tax=Flavobacterium restrictum TaxID=2594428 RepID=A0A553EDG1_9FLAO|nr:hypothetical protein [Flavobacterium restrictum]TRX43059.1 hypothetical protein FNW21_01615 [Flavobacterium restrictum]
MKNVNSFIKLLGENYYFDLIIDTQTEGIDFSKYHLPVNYQNNYYYELRSNGIHLKRREIINKIKSQYQDALSEIYINLSSQDPENFDAFLIFNIEAIKLRLKIIKADFYVDSKQSRYYSVIDDNPATQDLETYYLSKTKNDEFEIDDQVLNLILNSDFKKVESLYYIGTLYERSKALSFLPLSLFNIGHNFIIQLMKIQQIVNDLKEEKQVNPRIKWSGKKTHIGYFLGTLAINGFIDAPKNKNGEINFTAYAKLIKQNFDVEVDQDTLRKYLNPEDDKHQENKNSFDKAKSHIPNIIEVS